MTREKKLIKAAEEYQNKIVSINPNAEPYDFFNAFIDGANWQNDITVSENRVL